jgi:hypothetical protein
MQWDEPGGVGHKIAVMAAVGRTVETHVAAVDLMAEVAAVKS